MTENIVPVGAWLEYQRQFSDEELFIKLAHEKLLLSEELLSAVWILQEREVIPYSEAASVRRRLHADYRVPVNWPH